MITVASNSNSMQYWGKKTKKIKTKAEKKQLLVYQNTSDNSRTGKGGGGGLSFQK